MTGEESLKTFKDTQKTVKESNTVFKDTQNNENQPIFIHYHGLALMEYQDR
jgi:uncharacterized protein YpiB (UPF0302 family)